MIEVKEVSLEEAYEIHKQIPEFDDPKYTLEYFSDRIKDKKNLIIIGYIDKKPAGYIVSYDRYNDSSVYVWMVAVIPAFRKQGVLSAMMEYLEKWSKENGFTSIKIKTRNNRHEMQAYLVKNNFMFLEVEPRDEIIENRILLEKKI